MALNWTYNASEYKENDFSPIPAGDHRVRINDVVLRSAETNNAFGSGNDGFEITLDVSGHSSKLWFYLVLDKADTKKTNQRIGDFFNSFGITDYDLSHYRGWIGKIGGVRVKHEEYNGENRPKVAFCLSKKNQEKLPAWKGDAQATMPNAYGGNTPGFTEISNDDSLPF